MASLTSYDLAGSDPRPMSKPEVGALKRLTVVLPARPVIIQIGAERGCSTLAMLEDRPDAFIFSIDVGARPEEFTNLALANLESSRVVRGLGRSQNVGAFWPKAWQCDLLFIDGDHRRPAIDQDIAAWWPVVKPGGVMALHDYMSPEQRANAGRVVHGRVYEAVNAWVGRQDVPPERVLLVDRLVAFRKG